ncbi:YrzE family protein [Thermogemmatispora carboxidivorans]|uniref:YrzE family protein n=1 Tax=Thermogemmatispora carboxidivorans TaxID=1382306 RepID=UPI00069B70FE|nr:YrzE family protein [Thermogemmatispora carboxidivorans]
MNESEQRYPFHQHENEEWGQDEEEERHGRHRHHIEPLPDLSEEDEEERERRRRMHQREEPSEPELPRGRLVPTLIVGVVAGLLCAAENIALVLLNASLFTNAEQLASQNAYQLAVSVTTLCGLTIFISLVICAIAGFIVGKLAVQRSLGFLAGLVAGVLCYLGAIFLPRYIPGFPSNAPASGNVTFGGVIGGIVVTIIFMLLLGLLEGLAALFGAWLATRRHPYYVGYS